VCLGGRELISIARREAHRSAALGMPCFDALEAEGDFHEKEVLLLFHVK
jgi:hypothetical protein